MRKLALVVLAAALAACDEEQAEEAPADVPAGPDEAAMRVRRKACEFGKGARPSETLPAGAPIGDRMPVDHVILLMQENRSFDHYFSKLEGVTAAAPDLTNPGPDGAPVSRYHEPELCTRDVPHGWNAVHRQWNGGAMDGFVREAEPGGARALGYFDETQLPYYYALARTFAISDRHFCSLLGPTLPNRLFYFAGTSFGLVRNGIPPIEDANGVPHPSLFSRLSDAGVEWKVYSRGVASPAVLVGVFAEHQERFRPYDEFQADLDAGRLPAVAVVESRLAHEFGAGDDEHAPADVQVGQAWTASVVNAVMRSSAWPRTVLFLTYDEHGGFHDHVPPPEACPPDELEPILEPGDEPGRFDRLGVRVPLIAVSPYAKRGHVSHHDSDLTSVLRFVATRFDLPALTARDANAEPLLDLFDFEHPDLSLPELPEAVIDPAELDRCVSAFPEE